MVDSSRTPKFKSTLVESCRSDESQPPSGDSTVAEAGRYKQCKGSVYSSREESWDTQVSHWVSSIVSMPSVPPLRVRQVILFLPNANNSHLLMAIPLAVFITRL